MNDLMGMVIGGFQNRIQKATTIRDLSQELSKLKISSLIIKDYGTIFNLNVVFVENNIEQGTEKITIGFVPKNINLENEDKPIIKVSFSDFGYKGNLYYGTVKVHLH